MYARRNNGFFSPFFSFSPYVVNCFAVFETWKYLYALQVDNILKKKLYSLVSLKLILLICCDHWDWSCLTSVWSANERNVIHIMKIMLWSCISNDLYHSWDIENGVQTIGHINIFLDKIHQDFLARKDF